jgi:transcriptional regulator with XRE-family HTH domain
MAAMNEQPEIKGIGDRIAARIDELKISRKILSEKTGISPSALANIIGGRRQPGIDLVERLSEALQMSCHRLIVGRSWKSPEPSSRPRFGRGRRNPWRRLRRSRRDVTEIRERIEARRKRFEDWRQERQEEIKVLLKALGGDPFMRVAAEKLLSFFTRFRLPHVRRFSRLCPPESSTPIPGRKFESLTLDKDLDGHLQRMTPFKLQALSDYLRDLVRAPGMLPSLRPASGAAFAVEDVLAQPALRATLEALFGRFLDETASKKRPRQGGDAPVPPVEPSR